MQTPYIEQFAEAFNAAHHFGTAAATASELGALRTLHAAHGRDRVATLHAIEQDGYPLPTEITTEDLALSGAAHACGVAIHLATERGVEGRSATYESYTTKNRFDRFTALHLPEELRESWDSRLTRNPEASPKVSYPDVADVGFVYGIGKPSRYLPSQLMRNLEFIRLGKTDNDAADLNMYSVKWESLVPTIEAATSVTQLAGAIGAEVGKQLLANGLTVEQVAAILNSSYSIRGIKEEHGDIAEADQVRHALIENLATVPETQAVSTLLAA